MGVSKPGGWDRTKSPTLLQQERVKGEWRGSKGSGEKYSSIKQQKNLHFLKITQNISEKKNYFSKNTKIINYITKPEEKTNM